MIPVKVVVTEKGSLPTYQSPGSAGADLCASLKDDIVIQPGKIALVPTGLYIDIPYGYEAQVRPRSGLALKHGITLLNTPGTIDSDYRGEVKVIMANFGEAAFTVQHGMRIAQIVFAKVYKGEFTVVDTLTDTTRGSGGFGHTGL
ncbi:MAG TPA: dUTP diphosphatase [Spirochaetota bacterium]